ncbi:MAG TPA: hypothetical protein VHS97_18080, partial [Isosphaeraceae bacterium]|nr:hypothetical protein [Isosphaeraceae bacterium]
SGTTKSGTTKSGTTKSGTIPAKQGDGVSLRDQAQPQFGLIPAARMMHNDVANTRYNNLGDDDCAA